jgi:hypothetical protein
MTLALAQPAAPPTPAGGARRHGVSAPPGGGLTLDEVISGAWAGLSAGAPVACPACGGRMAPAAASAGRCASCSAWLS